MSSLRAMELFVAAVRERSFSAAGRRAGLSPASVSRHIGTLEAELGVQLLNRTTRTLSLTEAGQAYFLRIEPVLQDVRDAGAAAGAFQTSPRGTLRVHSRVMFGLRVITPLIPEFQQRYPGLRIDLRLSEQPAQLGHAEYDIDIRIGRSPDSGLMQRRLLESERILVASPAYLARMPPLQRPAELVAHTCLTYWLGPEQPVWRFLAEGRLEEIAVPSSCSTNNGQVLRLLAIMGHGIAMLDDYTVQPDLELGRLVRLFPATKVANTAFEQGIFAVFPQAQYVPAKIQAFLDFLGRRSTVPKALAAFAATQRDVAGSASA